MQHRKLNSDVKTSAAEAMATLDGRAGRAEAAGIHRTACAAKPTHRAARGFGGVCTAGKQRRASALFCRVSRYYLPATCGSLRVSGSCASGCMGSL